ncbi:MAG: galactose mutarotase [Ruminococcaceae bacterium]|nr:galactose mutarotase [Oscillospiraceae bacterium]
MLQKTKPFGVLPNGQTGELYEIKNNQGLCVHITNVAAAIVSIFAPDKDGNISDVVLGYDNAADYLSKGPYHGACVGRVANRIENSVFELDGKTYHLTPNYQGKHVLHGGEWGLDHHVFEVSEYAENSVCLETVMTDGEDGFPGNVRLKVIYTVNENNGLSIRYLATSDADTVLNLTNHAYFNLRGESAGSAMGHKLQIFSDEYMPLDEDGMVYGEILSVDPIMDFRTGKEILRDINEDHPQLKIANGYDHNFVLHPNGKELVLAARAEDPESGRVMEVLTNMPGVLLYTGNFLADHTVAGKDGRFYGKREGFCLETNFPPNALKYPNFVQPILKAGEMYDFETIYRFTTA